MVGRFKRRGYESQTRRSFEICGMTDESKCEGRLMDKRQVEYIWDMREGEQDICVKVS